MLCWESVNRQAGDTKFIAAPEIVIVIEATYVFSMFQHEIRKTDSMAEKCTAK
jgi:hypothetical protein